MTTRSLLSAGLCAGVVAACHGATHGTTPTPAAAPATPPAVTPAAPPAATPAPTAAAAPSSARRGYTDADVRFMQGMIGHHAQALAMTALVPARTTREDMRLLAQRIETSQRDEIALMRSWLEDHHEPVPSTEPMHHDMPGMTDMPGMSGMSGRMPGMLTPEQMDTLTRATGAAFDRLFLRYMIQHHEGALRMVAELFATPGAAQNSEIFRFATDVDADQRAEIQRMQALLARMPNDARR